MDQQHKYEGMVKLSIYEPKLFSYQDVNMTFIAVKFGILKSDSEIWSFLQFNVTVVLLLRYTLDKSVYHKDYIYHHILFHQNIWSV